MPSSSTSELQRTTRSGIAPHAGANDLDRALALGVADGKMQPVQTVPYIFVYPADIRTDDQTTIAERFPLPG